MREFPAKFVSTNVKSFAQFKFDRDICYLREAVYEHFLCEEVTEEIKKPEVKPKDGKKPVEEKKGNESKPGELYVPPKGNFEECFDLVKFKETRKPRNFTKMLELVTAELEKLGWKTRVGYGGDALWIYPPGSPPKSLPEW